MKHVIFLLLIFMVTNAYSQSMTRISIEQGGIRIDEMVNMSSYSTLGTTQGLRLGAMNCTNEDRSRGEILLINYSNPTDIKSGLILSNSTGNLSLKKVIHITTDEVFLLGAYSEAGSIGSMFFGFYNIKTHTFHNVNWLKLDKDPNFILNPIDVIYSNRSYYILAETYVNINSALNNKIVLIKYDGINVQWSKIYNDNNPIHSESPSSITLSPNGNLIVGGSFKSQTDVFYRMMLAQIDLEGQALNLKSIELKSADKSYSHRYGWIYVKSKSPNIHLFSQSVVGRDGEGPVLVTMFDTSLALRTWRNYTAPIRVESANIDGNFFLFGGQVPVESGGEGFAIMKVNSSNAIVEQFKNFKKGLKNSSIATSSASLYDRSSDKIWTMIKPNGGNENDLILLENQSVIDHECSEDLSSSVAKDPIDITDIDMVATPLELTMTKLDCNSNEVKLLNKEICTSSGTEINSKINLSIFPNPFSDHLTVESDQMIEHIEILSVDGRPHKSLFQKENKINLDLHLSQGIYFLKVYFINGNSLLEKVLCYY